MNTSHRRRVTAAPVALAAVILFACTVASGVRAQGVTWQQLQDRGWSCSVPPPFPDRVACFDPGRGRPFPGNPDPRPSYSLLAFDRVSGEFLFTVHLIRDDLYHGEPCGDEPYVFRPPIGYWECEHHA